MVNSFLSADQAKCYAAFREFAATRIEPFAADWDRVERIPDAVIAELGRTGYLGATLPTVFGGQGWDILTFGLLNEAAGRGDSAYTGILTVQAMVSMALLKWGSPAQKKRWLPPLASGEVLGAFAMTEPRGGSDLQGMATEYCRGPGTGELTLNGEKRWISCGQMAGVFLVFGTLEQQPVACLVPRDSAGLTIEPIRDMMGFRAAGLARLQFENVRVPADSIVGKPGFALSHVAPVGLHYGRLSTACSAVGLLRGCFEESTGYAAAREIGNQHAGDIGMIQSLIAKMGADLEAAGLLCLSACRAEDERRPEAYSRAFIAKYFASRAVVRAAADAVQILGAAGCHESTPIARYYRSCKIMEIIEGTTQIHEYVLGGGFVRAAAQRRRPVSPRLSVHSAQP
jgi:alkylation response protein AidB-like acyl-CoA dehydrogenase